MTIEAVVFIVFVRVADSHAGNNGLNPALSGLSRSGGAVNEIGVRIRGLSVNEAS